MLNANEIASEAGMRTPRRSRLDRSTVVVTGLAGFYVVMTAYAVFVFQQFSLIQVLGVGLAFAIIFAALLAILTPEIRAVRLRLTPLSVFLGLLLASGLSILAFTWITNPGPIWSDYFPPFPEYQLANGAGFHQDAVFHASLIQSILNVGYPSTGQHGLPFVPYHVLSHYTDALVLLVTRLEPYDSYGMFFHFKVVLFLSGIVVFLWMATRKLGRLAFACALVFLMPVLLSTWIGVGSHALWLPSLILLLSAGRIFQIVSDGPRGAKEYLFVFSVGVALGLGKVSSGLMFVIVVGVLLWLKNPRKRAPLVLIAGWVLFFGLYGRLFSNTGHGSGFQRPSVRGTLHFLDFFETYGGNLVEWNLGAIYLLLAFLCVFALVFRSLDSAYLAVATAVGIGGLALVTQTLAGLTQPDLYYFIFGLLVPLILLGFQYLLRALPNDVHLPERWAKVPPAVVRRVLVALLIASTWPLDKPPLNAFTNPLNAVRSTLTAANSAYFEEYNIRQAPADRVTVASIILRHDALDLTEGRPDGLMTFRADLRAFMEREKLTPRNTLLFVPKGTFVSSVAALGEPSWARGVMLYAVLGVPLLHGIEDKSMLSFGQSAYGPDAIQQTLAQFDPVDACDRGKQVVVVRSWAPSEFELACPA